MFWLFNTTFPFLDGDDPRSPSYSVYISQRIRFVRVCSYVSEFNNVNQVFTAKLLNKVIYVDIIQFVKHFLNSTRNSQS